MTRERQAKELTIKIIGSKNLNIDPVSDCEVYPLILAHDDAIRRECAEKAWSYVQSRATSQTFGMGLTRYDMDAAILGTEPAREMPKCTRPEDAECHAHSGDKCYNYFQCEPAREGS